ncbi:MAG: glycerol kinase GlpK [Alphaproteobacteria bacterium]|nr:glycerol kinase GlpK [Alphaproteobacteria bacterium]
MTKLLALDQGTTSSRAILFSKAGEILDVKQKELTLHYPNKGWVEQDAEDIWNDTLSAARGVCDRQSANDIAAIGITNQRETTIIWDRETGKPVYNAIVWQDRRTADYCQSLKDAGHEEMVSAKTGLLLDPYFSATKVNWILDNVDGARKKAEAGKLAFGTVDSFLLWRLTDGKVHATDATNASRTMLYNIVEGCWDDKLLALFDIPKSLLPDVLDNVSDFGTTDKIIDGASLQIGGIAGDQQAAAIGQACFEEGMVKSTYGTGCFALMNIGQAFKPAKNRLLTTIAYQFDGKVTYAIEGSIFVAGAAIQWLRDNLEVIADAAESEALAISVDDNNEVYFVPAFTGLGAPYWEPNARAAIVGLSRESNKAHIVRAALEAQGYQTLDLMDAFIKDSGFDPTVIRVDGGLVQNSFVCQFLSDMLERPVDVPVVTETTALGAAYLAGLHAGVFSSLDDISNAWVAQKNYSPSMAVDQKESLYNGWKTAVKRVLV